MGVTAKGPPMTDDWRNGQACGLSPARAHRPGSKYRKKVMTERVTANLRDSFIEVCDRYEASLDAFETDRDHAHLLISYPPKVACPSSRCLWPEVTKALGRALLVAFLRSYLLWRGATGEGEGVHRQPAGTAPPVRFPEEATA